MSEELYHLGVKALIRRDDGAVLLLRVDPQKMGGGEHWDLPGGRVGKGSTVEETLRREVLEETGVSDLTIGKNIGMMFSTWRIKEDGGEFGLILSVYECTIPRGTTITLGNMHVGYDWFPPAKAARQYIASKYPPEFCELIATLQ